MSDFSGPSSFAEAKERHEEITHHGATWVPIAAAILAVLAAVAGLLANQRSTAALVAKNQAILSTTKASDAYNEYESRSIKEHIYEALVAAGNARDPGALHRIAQHERSQAAPTLRKAHDLERAGESANATSETLLHGQESLEIGITLLDIAIVLVSISALATTRVLTIVAAVAAIAGLAACIFGALT